MREESTPHQAVSATDPSLTSATMTAAMAAAANLMARAAAIHHLPGALPHVGAETNQRAAEFLAHQMNLGNNRSPISDHGSPPQSPPIQSQPQEILPLKGINLTTSSLQNSVNKKLRMLNDEDKLSGDEGDEGKKFDIDINKKHENGSRQIEEDEDELEV